MKNTISKALRLFALDLERASGRMWPASYETAMLKRRAAAHRALCERACNEDDVGGRIERRLSACEASITAMLGEAMPGVERVTFSHDPRGGTVHLHLESGRSNSWGGAEEGWVL